MVSFHSDYDSSISDGTVAFDSRRKSEGPLRGISSSALLFNTRQHRSLHALAGGGHGDGAERSANAPSGHSAGPERGAALDEQAFNGATDRLERDLEDIRKRHDAFVPSSDRQGSPVGRGGRGGSNGGRGGSSLRPAWMALSREDMERQAERLEAYKMVRKVEPELQPMSRAPLFDIAPTMKPASTFIRLNCTPEYMQIWSPQGRCEKLAVQSEERSEKIDKAHSVRDDIISTSSEQFLQAILRKRRQGEAAKAGRSEWKKGSHSDASARAEQWIAIWVAILVAKTMKQELETAMEPPSIGETMEGEQKVWVGTRKPRSMPSMIGSVMSALSQHSHQKVSSSMEMLAAMRQKERKLKEMKHGAKVIYDGLIAWKVAGRCFLALRGFAQRIVKMQRWWRTTAKQLKESIDRVSKRFQQLERQELLRKLSKGTPATESRRGNTTLSLEEKLQLEKVDDAVRMRFIENDLRARRYNHLPKIALWEAEVRTWKQEYADWQSANEAHRVMGTNQVSHFFKWPPTRPTCLPKAHPLGEVNGTLECPEVCGGRQGDEMILEMIHNARRSGNKGGGWTKMLVSSAEEKVAKLKGRRSMKQGRQNGRQSMKRSSACQPQETLRLFGEVSDQELAKWGLGLSTMPGFS